MDLTNITNTVLAVGTIVVEVASVLLLVMIFTKDRGDLARWFSEKSLALITLVSVGSMIASLVYSEIIGYSPCLMCWYQRVAIYGIAIVSLVALIKKQSKEVWSYVSTLSVIGVVVAAFHVFSRFTNSEVFDCSASGPSCLQELFTKFGYIDIPVMSLSALIFIILLVVNRKKFN